MKPFRLVLPGLIVAALTMLSCGNNDKDSACTQEQTDARYEVLVYTQQVSIDAQIAYTQNENAETCKAYKDAYDDYLDALANWIDCLDEFTYPQWQEVYLQAVEKRKTIPC